MERTIYRLLAHVREGGGPIDGRVVRADLLTSREVALVLGAGVAEARSIDGNDDQVRNALACLAWRLDPQASMPPTTPAIRVLAAVTRGLEFVAPHQAIGEGLRWLVREEQFWTLTVRRPR